jgi:endonuclease/exonuclease/phosphatase family metal-dependent hydrolase
MIIQYIKEFDIWIYNVHLDPYDKTGKTREKQINYILKKINKISNFKRSILLGDFNTLNLKDYTNEKIEYMNYYEYDFLSHNNFGDIPKYFIDSLQKYNIINPETSVYKKRVDYIFISKDLNYHNSYIIPFSTSDHLPVIIEL